MSCRDLKNNPNVRSGTDVQGALARTDEGGVQIVSPHGPGRGSHFITVPCVDGDTALTIVERAMSALRDTGATIVTMDIMGLPMNDGLPLVEGIAGAITWPLTWIAEPNTPMAGGIQIWAESDATVTPILLGKHIVGSLIDTSEATICRLGGLDGRIPTRTPVEQTEAVLNQMEDGLHAVGMGFGDTIRTWYYNCDIVSWYGDFNLTRDQFFTEHRVYEGLLPASTGIGACNVSGSSIVGGLLAVKPKIDTVSMAAIPSPLQCSATEYGSSFSRAAELDFPSYREILISGTASIESEGATIHDHDIDGQILVTLEVIEAILLARGMKWTNVTRAIAYVKHAEDIPRFEYYRHKLGLDSLPILTMVAEVCRDDLLFEVELDAIAVTT
jgi:enamine deaminase RidA (YjgF/YER057c/UK114 family)